MLVTTQRPSKLAATDCYNTHQRPLRPVIDPCNQWAPEKCRSDTSAVPLTGVYPGAAVAVDTPTNPTRKWPVQIP